MKQRLTQLIHLPLSAVQQMHAQGQIDSRTLRAFTRLHAWMAVRWGGIAGDMQDRFWADYGSAAFARRMNRMRAAFGFAPVQY